MAHPTETEEKTIEAAMKLLESKHNAVPQEVYSHYVVKGEFEEECDSEEYCEDCIEKAVKQFKDRWYQKRGLENNRVNQLKRTGYVVSTGWNSQYECRSVMMQRPSTADIKRYTQEIKKKYKNEPEPIYSYRYYQRDSDSTTRSCELCGKYINVCVTADEQEIEHWESFDDSEFLLSTMSDDTAYQLYEVLQFIHQAEDEVYQRGVLIAEKIMKLNSAV